MQQHLKDLMARTIKQMIERRAPNTVDAIDLAERISDALEPLIEMQYEDGGIATVRAGAPTPWGKNPVAEVEPETSHFMAPPPSKSSVSGHQDQGRLLVLPGDKEFAETVPKEEPGRNVLRASMARRRVSGRPASNSPQKQLWEEGVLIGEIDRATPPEIVFDIDGPGGGKVRIVAKKNILNRQGLGSVVLTYKDDRVGDGGDIALVAQHPFSLYDEDIDVDAAMESIAKQLAGIYRDRSDGMAEPRNLGPEPDMNMLAAKIARGDSSVGVGENYGSKMEPHLKPVGGENEAFLRVMAGVKQGNKSTVPSESRLK